MTDREKLQRDIDALLESIQKDYAALDNPGLPEAARAAVRRRLDFCAKELAGLLARLETAEPTK